MVENYGPEQESPVAAYRQLITNINGLRRRVVK